jgi:hypothetical protein
METVEAARSRYRPERILTLFVGESAPYKGKFFYYGNSAMARYMERAMKTALGKNITILGDPTGFLDTFKAFGWYLDDLVLSPVNHLPKSKRQAKCLAAQSSLANRIPEYRSLAIVTLLVSIKHIVEAATIAAGNNASQFSVPFPGNGHQARFQHEMVRIIRNELPRLPLDAH